MGATLELRRSRSALALVVLCLRRNPASVSTPRSLRRLLGSLAPATGAHLSAMRSSTKELDGSFRPVARRLLELYSRSAIGRWRDGGVRVRRPGPGLPAAREAAMPRRDPRPTRRTAGTCGDRLESLRRMHRDGSHPLASRLEPTTGVCTCVGIGAATGPSDWIEAAAGSDPSMDPCGRGQTARSTRPRQTGAVGFPLSDPGGRRAPVTRR